MERCKECELAIYCFSDSSSWIFRTTREMEEKKLAICDCPISDQVKNARAGKSVTVTGKMGQGEKRR
jgi:3-hydroxyisobutyrate dehydrogenase-like beta-hydroxyacid dehydrogenase